MSIESGLPRQKPIEKRKSKNTEPETVRSLLKTGALELNKEYSFTELRDLLNIDNTKSLIGKLDEEANCEYGSTVKILSLKKEGEEFSNPADPLELELDRKRLKLWYARIKINTRYSMKLEAKKLGVKDVNIFEKILKEYAEAEKEGVLQISDDKEYFKIVIDKKERVKRLVEREAGKDGEKQLKDLHTLLLKQYGANALISLDNIMLPGNVPARNKYIKLSGRKHGLKLLAEIGLAEKLTDDVYILRKSKLQN